ncbi:MAG TPA: hypothetical protein VK943_04350 [Arenibaculum sp.]|nr:hypothetical protein [Arenibaculum sp.]
MAALAAAWLVLPPPGRAEPPGAPGKQVTGGTSSAAGIQAAAIPGASEPPAAAPDPIVIGVPVRIWGSMRPVRPPVAVPVAVPATSSPGRLSRLAPPVAAMIPAGPVPERVMLPKPPTMPLSRRLRTVASTAPMAAVMPPVRPIAPLAAAADTAGADVLIVVPAGQWEPERLADHTACVGGRDVLLGRQVFANSVIVARDNRAAAVERGLCQAILVTSESEAQAARRQFAGMGITAEIHRPDP